MPVVFFTPFSVNCHLTCCGVCVCVCKCVCVHMCVCVCARVFVFVCVCVWCRLYLLVYCPWMSLLLLLYCPSLFVSPLCFFCTARWVSSAASDVYKRQVCVCVCVCVCVWLSKCFTQNSQLDIPQLLSQCDAVHSRKVDYFTLGIGVHLSETSAKWPHHEKRLQWHACWRLFRSALHDGVLRLMVWTSPRCNCGFLRV